MSEQYFGDATAYVVDAAKRANATSFRVRTLDRPRKYAAMMAGQVRWVTDIEQASSFSRSEAREIYQCANAAGLCVTTEGIF